MRAYAWALLLISWLGWGLDLATKQAAVHYLSARDSIPVLGTFFQFTLVYNPGAAFSTGQTFTLFISLFAIGALAVVLWLARGVASWGWVWAFGLLIAGIVGNLTDRLFRDPAPLRGHVVDFLHLTHWPVFNLADVWISIAAGLIILQTLRGVERDGSRVRHAVPLNENPVVPSREEGDK